jgi:hypothetical protein
MQGSYDVLLRGQPHGSFRYTPGREVRAEIPLDESRRTPVEIKLTKD